MRVEDVIFIFLIVIDISQWVAASVFNHMDELVVHDQVHPSVKIDEKGYLSDDSPLPDWSDLRTDRTPRYIEILIVVDAAVNRHYGHDTERLRMGVLSLMHAVNLYTYQLNLRMVVVDVVPMRGNNASLQQLLEWRQDAEGLPAHDVAILLRHRYEGGIAYVNGACKSTGVGICGYFPEAPFGYASVFFHELSHLIGLSHNATANCRCGKENRGNCLTIHGFENECSAQALWNMLPKKDCLQQLPQDLPRNILAMCGNGIVENEEECDCGPTKYCDNPLCEPRGCKFKIQKKYLYFIVTISLAFIIFFLLLATKVYIRKTFCSPSPCSTKKINPSGPHSPSKQTLFDIFVSSPSHSPVPKMKSTGTETSIIPEFEQLPTIECRPIRPAPPRPTIFERLPGPPIGILDQAIPLHAEDPGPPGAGYMKMHNPFKNNKQHPMNPNTVRFPQINCKTDDMLPSGRSAAAFRAVFEEELRAKTLNRNHVIRPLARPPGPPVPDRKLKPSLGGSSPNVHGDAIGAIPHLYDQPA